MAAIATALILALVSASNDNASVASVSNTRKLAAIAKQQKLQGEDAAVSEEAPAGTGKELIKSVEQAVTEQATPENSHYIGGYTDKSVHLLVILLLIIIPGGIYFFWKTQKRLNETGGNALFDTDKVTADFNKGMGDFGNQLGTFGETAKGWGAGLVDQASTLSSGIASQASGLASQAGSHLSAAGSKIGIGKKEGDVEAPAETKK